MKKFTLILCLACATNLTKAALIAGWNFNSLDTQHNRADNNGG